MDYYLAVQNCMYRTKQHFTTAAVLHSHQAWSHVTLYTFTSCMVACILCLAVFLCSMMAVVLAVVMSPSVCHKPLLYRNDWTAWASAHRGKWGQLTPMKNGWKIKKRKHAKKEVFWIFWEHSGQAGVDHLCWLHIYSDILQNAPFCGQIFKIFFASGGKTAGRFSCFFLSRKFPSTVCLRKFGYFQKLWYFPLELLLKLPT